MENLVSIVIPTYNRALDLRRAIFSIIKQTHKNWELIIVDNYSDDNTDEIISSFKNQRIRLFKIHNNGIIAKSRNYGIAQSKGEYIAFLESDDWWTEYKLESSVKFLNKGADFIYHDLYLANKKKQKFFLKKTLSQDLQSNIFYDLLKKGCVLTTSSVVIRKNILIKIGGLPEDPKMGAWCDFFGWLKIAKETDKFIRLPGVYGYYWNGGGNYTTPERTIQAIGYFEEVFSSEIKRMDLNSLRWLNYAKGRVYYQLNYYKKSKFFLHNVKFDLTLILMSVKVKLFLIMIKIKLK